jgi:WD40 repeat protein
MIEPNQKAQAEGGADRRIEIVHESLLSKWPRLVRWQAQDVEGAQLRDELRQAAQLWDQHERADDFLWSGTAFREYQLWHERYSGGLTELEEEFAGEMKSLANRRRRQRRLVVVSAFVALLTVLAIVVSSRQQALAEARRAEAQKLIALGQVQFEEYPTAALAYATKSIELADSKEARLLALKALWEGPTAFIVNNTSSLRADFSPTGNWLVQTHDFHSSLTIVSRDGTQRVLDQPSVSGRTRWGVLFENSQDLFKTWGGYGPGGRKMGDDTGRLALWSASEARLLAWVDRGVGIISESTIHQNVENGRALYATGTKDLVTIGALYTDGSHVKLGDIRLTSAPGEGSAICLDRSGKWLGLVDNHEVSVVTIGDTDLADRLPLGRHEGNLEAWCLENPLGRSFWTVNHSGEIKQWDPSGSQVPRDLELPPNFAPYELSKDGTHLIAGPSRASDSTEFSIWSISESGLDLVRNIDRGSEGGFNAFDPNGPWFAMRGPLPSHRLWLLAAPAGSEPILLRRGPTQYSHRLAFSRDGRWLATNDQEGLLLWPLERPYPALINVEFKSWSYGVSFSPNGEFLAASTPLEIRAWPLEGEVPANSYAVFEAATPGSFSRFAVAPDGELFAAGAEGTLPEVLIGKAGEEPRPLYGDKELQPGIGYVSFSPDGRHVAAIDNGFDPANMAFHVWEVATGQKAVVLRLKGNEFRGFSRFSGDGRLLTGSTKGVLAWDVAKGAHEVLIVASVQRAASSADGRRLLLTEEGEGGAMQDPAGSPTYHNLDTGEAITLTNHGLQVRALGLNKEGTIAITGDAHGVIRVGLVTGEEPHLLLGHEGPILDLAIDPRGRWVASAGMDKTLRLWPMPDLSKPPLHTLPRYELIAKLKTLTNIRVVRDEEASTGWILTHDPFPGWETVPTW